MSNKENRIKESSLFAIKMEMKKKKKKRFK